ncbi:unnamed protein product [Mycena citricolor]|uniref:Acetyl-CoA synthetase-like protein n=1 Tax=Mycena citricolor TaxID=2018698 RepID=A0AAD2K888_9AGAR|nr:unnamed protein product [Mycena citricolor]
MAGLEFAGPPLAQRVPDDLTIPQFMLETHHPLRPDQGSIPCLIEDETGRRVTLPELRTRTRLLAYALREKYGIGMCNQAHLWHATCRSLLASFPGNEDVVLLCMPNDIDFPVAMWAVQYNGGIYTGANPGSTADELLYQLQITEATMIVAHPSTYHTVVKAARLAGIPLDRVILPKPVSGIQADSIEDLEREYGGRDLASSALKLAPGEGTTKIACLCMSSGTTGKPKAVAISHAAVIANLVQLSSFNPPKPNATWSPGDVVLGILPLFHIAGLVFTASSFTQIPAIDLGADLMMIAALGLILRVVPKFDFVSMLDSVVRHRIQHLILVPPIAVALCKHPAARGYDLTHVKFIGSGAAPLTSEVEDELQRIYPAKTGQAYGLTETSTIVSMVPFYEDGTSGSIGRLIPGVRVKLVKADGTQAGYDEPGELVVKTPSLAMCYHKNAKATDESFNEGWFRTGDEAKISRNGDVWITDRLKVGIDQSSGLPGVTGRVGRPAPVLPLPDDKSGEVPMAFVVLTEGALQRSKSSPEQAGEIKTSIQKLVADNKVRYKHLDGGIEFADFIPKNPSGKILRRVLKEQVAARLQAKL